MATLAPLFFQWIFFVLAGKKDHYNMSDGFEFQLDPTSDYGVMVILVTSIEGASAATIQNIDFSNTKGQLTLQSEVGSGRNSNSSEIL